MSDRPAPRPTSCGFGVPSEDGTLVADGDATRVCVDKEFRPTDIPAAFRTALEKHLAASP